MGAIREKMKQQMEIRGLSENTQDSYLRAVKQFVQYFKVSRGIKKLIRGRKRDCIGIWAVCKRAIKEEKRLDIQYCGSAILPTSVSPTRSKSNSPPLPSGPPKTSCFRRAVRSTTDGASEFGGEGRNLL